MTERIQQPWHYASDNPEGVVQSKERSEMFDSLDRRPRYEILRVVNRGGMGEIALAQAKGVKGFEKLVVLKRLRADAEREDHIQMFDVEQEVMSRIEHPNIVQVFDQPYIDGIPYMAMEYIRGRNLDQLIRAALHSDRELPLNLSLTIASEVLRGLAFVHRLKDSEGRPLGVVHQDMTPSNVMVSFFGEVKITDFGISYVTSRDGGLRQGVLKGKPRYVAPEVLAGKRVNNRADIYGVGVVLFELLTGKALFARTSIKETLSAVARNELPNLESDLSRFGSGVANLLTKSLCKDPTDRYRSAEAMAADVLNELSKRGGPMPPATLGYLVRELFKNDPDVPELDPDFEQAINRAPIHDRPDSLAPRNLDETLQELDRLLGPSNSVDLFTLPPELAIELDELSDMDPFNPKTPLPEFIGDGRSHDVTEERASLFHEQQDVDQKSNYNRATGPQTDPSNGPITVKNELRLGSTTYDSSIAPEPVTAKHELRPALYQPEGTAVGPVVSEVQRHSGDLIATGHDIVRKQVYMAYGRGTLFGMLLGVGICVALRLLGF